MAGLDRQRRQHAETTSWSPSGLEGAAEGLGAFGHPGDSAAGAWIALWRPCCRGPGGDRGRNRCVVVDFDRQGAAGVGDLDGGRAPGRMPGRVGERLLDDAVGGQADLGWKEDWLSLPGEVNLEAGRARPGREIFKLVDARTRGAGR